MSFNLFVKTDAASAASEVGKLETALNKTTDAANRARDAQGRFLKAGTEGAAAMASGTDKAAAATGRAAQGHKDAAAAAADHGDAITNLIALTTAYIGLHQLESVADGYVEIRNKTNSVATSTENLNALMGEQFRIAQETRSSWEDLAGTYQRISNAGRGLGLSQRQILDLTEELSMGMRLSGSSSREASMTMMELTHAFTVGTLTGREFRVMMKDAPALMHELQVVSGKTGAEFAEMGKHGKFTAQTLVEWFDKAKVTIADKFGQTIPTISEGFTLIRNAAEKFFGEAGLGSGVLQGLGLAMRFVADHFETFGKVILGVGEALVGLYVIEKIVTMVKALTIAIAANPLGALFTALVVGVSLLRQFGDQMETSRKIWTNVGDKFVTIGDNVRALWEQLKVLGGEIMTFVHEAWATLTGAVSDGLPTGKIEDGLSTILRMFSGFVGAIRGIWQILSEDTHKTFQIMEYWITSAMVGAANASLHAIEAIASAPRRAMFDMLNKTDDTRAAASAAARKEVYETDNQDADKNWSVTQERQSTNQRLYKQVQADLGYGQYANTQGDTKHYATAGDVDAEFKRRLDMRYQASLVNEYAQRGLDESGQDKRQGTAKLFPDIPNPYAGTQLERTAKEAMNDIKYEANKSMEEFDKLSRNIAASRSMDEQNRPKGAVSTVGGPKDAAIHDEKAAKAAEVYAGKLRAIEEATNPVTDAQEKLAHAEAFLTDAVAHHGLSQERATRDIENYKAKLEDALHPFDAWIRKQGEAFAALRSTSEETERASQLTALIEDQKKKGAPLDELQIAQATRIIALGQEHAQVMRAEQGFMADAAGAQKIYAVQLTALGDLLEHGELTATEYAAAIDKVRAAYLAAGELGKGAGAGAERAQIRLRQESQNLGGPVEKAITDAKGPTVQYETTLAALNSEQAKAALTADQLAHAIDANRAAYLAASPAGKTFTGGLELGLLKAKADAEAFGATLATTVLGNVEKLGDAFVTAANGGEVAWGKMIDSMIQDLERLILKQLEMMAISALFNAIAPGSGAVAAPIAGVVTGSEGTDRIAPGTRAYPMPAAPSTSQPSSTPTANQGPPVIHIHNHYDQSVGVAAIQSPAGQSALLNVLRANPGARR